MPDLTGKIAFVSGASRGLGLQFSRALAKAGADLVVTSRTLDSLEPTVAEIEALLLFVGPKTLKTGLGCHPSCVGRRDPRLFALGLLLLGFFDLGVFFLLGFDLLLLVNLGAGSTGAGFDSHFSLPFYLVYEVTPSCGYRSCIAVLRPRYPAL